MIKAATYGKGRALLDKAVSERLSFKTSGSLRGEADPGYSLYNYGMLGGSDLDAFLRDRDNITYMIFSYNTPIAWECVNGKQYRVEEKFSTTTSKHMGAIWRFWKH